MRSKKSNPRISPKERGLLKGAIRRVFSRSDLRRKIIDDARIEHSDPSRPRVKKWCRCQLCKQPTAAYQMNADHVDPLIPVHRSLEEMSWDEVVDRTWCKENNLQAICLTCHKAKSKLEMAERRKHKRKRK